MTKKDTINKDGDLKSRVGDAAQDAVKVIADAAERASHTIASSAESATRLLASSAESATRLLASNASDALQASKKKDVEDHDILVVLKSRMEDIRNDIKDLKDNTTKRIDVLESSKLDVKDCYATLYKKDVEQTNSDHETRIRLIETNITKILTYGSIGIVLLGVIEGVILKFWK